MVKNRLEYLDSLRGLAAISVAIFHYILFYKSEILSHTDWYVENILLFKFQNTIDLGKISVVVFFMISGFVIPYSIKSDGVLGVKQFAVSRFFRLYPAYWVSVIIGFLLYNISIKNALINLTMLQQFIGIPNVLGLYWTLQMELIFYFLIIILLLLRRHNNLKLNFKLSVFFLVIALLLSFLRFYFKVKLPVAFPLSLSVMFFGTYWKNFILEKDSTAQKRAYVYIGFYFVLIPLISKFAYDIDFGHQENWVKYIITYYVGILIFIMGCVIKYSNSFLVFLGKISYSVYLFHPITYVFFSKYVDCLNLRVGFRILLHLIILIVVSYIIYYFIEKRSINIGKKVLNNLNIGKTK